MHGSAQERQLFRTRLSGEPTPQRQGHSFDNQTVHILNREDRWFETGVKKAIMSNKEKQL